MVDAAPGDCFSVHIGAASTSLLGPPPGLLTPPVATDLSQNARHLQVGWAFFLGSFSTGDYHSMLGCLVLSFVPGAFILASPCSSLLVLLAWARIEVTRPPSDRGDLSSGPREFFLVLLGIKELEILEAASDLRI